MKLFFLIFIVFQNLAYSQVFKIKRLLKGAINFVIKGCKHEKIKINISFSNYAKIKKDRLKALKNGTLLNPEKVPATIIYQNEKFKAKIRLRETGLQKKYGVCLFGVESFEHFRSGVRSLPLSCP